MLEVFYKKFYKWGYIKFSRLNKYIQVLKEIFMTKTIYTDGPSGHIN